MNYYFYGHFIQRGAFVKNRFAVRLGLYRVFAGETQQELADAIHVKLSSLRTWEQGIHNCSFDNLIAICEHYQISADYLLGLTPDDDPYSAKLEKDILTSTERKAVILFEEYLRSKHKK